jgi:hypothetical protein
LHSRDSVIERYETASAADDFETMRALRHADWQMLWPQSGEIVRGHDNYVAMRTNRPEGGRPRVEPLMHGGSGDTWWSEAVIHYADGSRWLGVTIYDFSGNQIATERVYFVQPLPAPEWRSRWVERGKPSII